MPHKKRAYRNHIRVKRILANSELSLLDKKKPKKGFERVPRRDYNSFDCKREELLLNDESDDDTHKKRSELKKHINKELQEQHQEQKFIIPKRSRKNKYYLMNHPELEGVITNLLKTNKRKYQCTKQERQEQNEPPKKKTSDESKSSICDALVSHMITSRFRYLNEKLYTSTSTEAQKMFQQDLQSFSAYHQGYQASMVRWPYQPLDEIITYIRNRSPNLVIVDMGCGDARLARTLKSTHPNIHSFDLVSLNEYVQVCDIAHTPLKSNSVDIVVFCLSLMGTNLTDFIYEAHRILRLRGTLKIVEIASRFENQSQKFIRKIESIGFQCSKTNSLEAKNNSSPKYFYTFHFIKTLEQIKSKPILELAPCLHKRR